jgi:hypothetical protein
VSLHTLDLSFNQLSGPIPSSLRDLRDMSHLSLQNNQLRGSIPSSLGKLNRLNILDLSSNLLGGSIPSSLVSLTNLQDLLINNNSLSGPVPELSSSLECEMSNNDGLCAQKEFSNKCTVGLPICNLDCRMMHAWLPKMFDDSTCCSQSGIGCIDERITNLYVSFKFTLF